MVRKGLTIERVYTTAGVHPYDEVTWERRDVVQTNWKTGETVFEQRGVEFPDFWASTPRRSSPPSTSAARSAPTPREWSLRQLIDRVVLTYTKAGKEHGYFATDADAEVFEHELTWMLLHQVFSFNSPGLVQRRHAVAAAGQRLLHPRPSTTRWTRSSTGTARRGLSSRAAPAPASTSPGSARRKELLSSGGTASGPVSFMRGADASAGTIKSGGATRRAAKMVVLDVDHPDIEEFIETKAREEDKIRALRDAGFDMDLGGKDITSVQYQNANNSVRVTDEFMRAVEDGEPSSGCAPAPTGEVIETVDARGLFAQDRRRPPGSAPTRASSTTTRSTTGTPTPRPAGSPRPTRARST